MSERIVAVGLLTRRDLDVLGPTFDRIWPVEEAPHFTELLRAIDEADRKLEPRDSNKLELIKKRLSSRVDTCRRPSRPCFPESLA